MDILGWSLLIVAGLALLATAVVILTSLRPIVFRIEGEGTNHAALMDRVDDLWQPRVLRIGGRWSIPFGLWRQAIAWLLYRPPENSVGVIYLSDRLWYIAGPNESVLVIPRLHSIKRPISLKTRRADTYLTGRLTKDGVPMDITCLVYFRVDVRWAKDDFRIQALEYNDEIWRQIASTSLTGVVNDILSGLMMRQALADDGKQRLKRLLSEVLAERALSLGLIINPCYGVTVDSIEPAKRIWDAMVEEMAAPSLGDAAHDAVRPMLEVAKQHPDIGWEVLQMEWAAAIARGEIPPGVLLSLREGQDRSR